MNTKQNNINDRILESKFNIYNIIFNHLKQENSDIEKEINKNLEIYENFYSHKKRTYIQELNDFKIKLSDYKERNLILSKLKNCKSFLSLRYTKELQKMQKEEDLIKKIERIENKIKSIELRVNKLKEYCDDFIKLNFTEEIFKTLEKEKSKIKKGKK